MTYRTFEPLSRQLTIMIGLTVVGFMTFGLVLSFYRNILFEHTLERIRQQNRILREKVEMGYRDLEYYHSAQYKDKYAKENLGRINAGEHVLIILPERGVQSTAPAEATGELSEQQEARYFELLRQMPVIEHWRLYLFRREDIAALQRNL